jgi:hypothetical protein
LRIVHIPADHYTVRVSSIGEIDTMSVPLLVSLLLQSVGGDFVFRFFFLQLLLQLFLIILFRAAAADTN